MKKYILAAVIASGALIGLPALAAPLASSSDLKAEVQSSAVPVGHCRYWSGGWGCEYRGGYDGHSRHWSHRRHGSGWQEGEGHSRHFSHQRHGSWKRDF
jgi:hypothetical protein